MVVLILVIIKLKVVIMFKMMKIMIILDELMQNNDPSQPENVQTG